MIWLVSCLGTRWILRRRLRWVVQSAFIGKCRRGTNPVWVEGVSETRYWATLTPPSLVICWTRACDDACSERALSGLHIHLFLCNRILHICLINLLQSNRTGTANPSACLSLSYMSHIWSVSAPLSKTLQTQRSTRQLVLALHSRFWSRIQDSNQRGPTKSQQNERTTEPNGHFRIPRPPVILSCWLLDIVNLEVGFTKNISSTGMMSSCSSWKYEGPLHISLGPGRLVIELCIRYCFGRQLTKLNSLLWIEKHVGDAPLRGYRESRSILVFCHLNDMRSDGWGFVGWWV